MKKFWKWMKENEHGTKVGLLFDDSINGTLLVPTKQMLIGYMIKYLSEEHHEFIGLSNSSSNQRQQGFVFETIEDYYERLVTHITKGRCD